MTSPRTEKTLIGIDIGGTSVKAAAIRDGSVLWTGRGGPYERPKRQTVIAAIRQAVAGAVETGGRVGLCLPGLFDRSTQCVTLSVNVPGIVGVPVAELLSDALGLAGSIAICTDAHATAHDLYTARKLSGRLFVLALGTGVGAAVLDDGATPLCVDGDSPGHFGQLDVSIEGSPVVGPDGGAGSLEGYVGITALSERYGLSFIDRLPTLTMAEPPIRAVVRAIRIAHALYRPRHIVLAGGIGLRLRSLLPSLQAAISDQLTRIAQHEWTLSTGDSDFHAALGAAKLAGVGKSESLTKPQWP